MKQNDLTPLIFVPTVVDYVGFKIKNKTVGDLSSGDGRLLDEVHSRFKKREYHRSYFCESKPERRQICHDKKYTYLDDNFHDLIYRLKTYDSSMMRDVMYPVSGKPWLDVILLNPPFKDGAYVQHIIDSFTYCLKPGGTLVSVVPTEYPLLNTETERHLEHFVHTSTTEYGYKRLGSVCSADKKELECDRDLSLIRITK